MRRLILNVSERIVFGDDNLALGKLIQTYFEYRRSLSATRLPPRLAARRELIRMGGQLDSMLRGRLKSLQAEIAKPDAAPACLFGRLTMLATSQEVPLTDDQLIAHANMLFMSSSEPLAVTLTWILLLLSQMPELRVTLRQKLMAACERPDALMQGDEFDYPLLSGVIHETLRMLPPNAIMVRLTTSSGSLLGYELPPYCEVVLSPFISHRDPKDFASPSTFNPHRWRGFRPSMYTYFPFGIGARYCIGRHLANFILSSVLARILIRYDVILAHNQDLDWKINITLMPASEPVARFLPLNAMKKANAGGRLGGPVATLAGL
jgi:cytochrome P450